MTAKKETSASAPQNVGDLLVNITLEFTQDSNPPGKVDIYAASLAPQFDGYFTLPMSAKGGGLTDLVYTATEFHISTPAHLSGQVQFTAVRPLNAPDAFVLKVVVDRSSVTLTVGSYGHYTISGTQTITVPIPN